MRAVIITSADGFVGHHLTEYFAEQGTDVYAVVMENSPMCFRVEGLDNVHFIPSSCIDLTSIHNDFRIYTPYFV